MADWWLTPIGACGRIGGVEGVANQWSCEYSASHLWFTDLRPRQTQPATGKARNALYIASAGKALTPHQRSEHERNCLSMPEHDLISSPNSRQLSMFDDPLFDDIKHTDDAGQDYWTARELMSALNYTEWRNFKNVIKKAQISCKTAGYGVNRHFVDTNKIADLGNGLSRSIPDVKLSKYACHLIAMNGDTDKPLIAQAQAYFSVQTHRQEEADKSKALKRQQDVTAYQLNGKPEAWAQARVASKEAQNALNAALYVTHEDHAPNYGRIGAAQNQGLFDMTKREIVAYLGLLPKDEPKYRDMLGKYAHQAIELVDVASKRQMLQLRRELTTEEQVAIVQEKAQQAARIMREAALMAGVDFISGAPLDESGKALITRNVRLLK